MTNAPDFSRRYPSSGALIGPAWQIAWDLLEAAKTPVRKRDLMDAMTEAGIVDKTAENLLLAAYRARKLDVEYHEVGSRRHAFYSISTR